MADIYREVRDGEQLSGHRSGSGDFPEIHIYDGLGAGDGSCMFSIVGFHFVDVMVHDHTTTLSFEGKLPVKVFGGIVKYCVPEAESPQVA